MIWHLDNDDAEPGTQDSKKPCFAIYLVGKRREACVYSGAHISPFRLSSVFLHLGF